jgi:hypothetical protein
MSSAAGEIVMVLKQLAPPLEFTRRDLGVLSLGAAFVWPAAALARNPFDWLEEERPRRRA